MRYTGGGIGHYKLDLADTRTLEPDNDPDLPSDNPGFALQANYQMDTEDDFPTATAYRAGDAVEEVDELNEIQHISESEEVKEFKEFKEVEQEQEEDEIVSEDEDGGESEGLKDDQDVYDDDLGAEDGEEGFEDAEDAEGYAPL